MVKTGAARLLDGLAVKDELRELKDCEHKGHVVYEGFDSPVSR